MILHSSSSKRNEFIALFCQNNAECAVAVCLDPDEAGYMTAQKSTSGYSRAAAPKSPRQHGSISGTGIGWEDFQGDVGRHLFAMSLLKRAAKQKLQPRVLRKRVSALRGRRGRQFRLSAAASRPGETPRTPSA